MRKMPFHCCLCLLFFQIIQVIMTVIGGDPGYCSVLLSDLYKIESHTDVTLCSDDRCVVVHTAVLSMCSDIMSNILSSSVVDTIILPGFSSVLSDFVSLVYTGEATIGGEENTKLLTGLCSLLGMHTSVSIVGKTPTMMTIILRR